MSAMHARDDVFAAGEPGLAYHAPRDLEEALALLARYGEEAKVLAGGQSLLVFLSQGLIAPAALIGLRRVPGLDGIEERDGGLTIGAMTTQHALESDPTLRTRYPALAEAAQAIATPQVRQRGTLGGNLCHANPTGDPPAALIALGASIEIVNGDGARRVPVQEFFRDYMEPALQPDELLTAVHLPPPVGSAYLKHRIRGVDSAIVGVGAGIALAPDGTCSEARIGLSGAATTPLRAVAAEAVIRGKPLSDVTIQPAAEAAAQECDPLDDTEASADYRREMVAVFVRRALARAAERARQGDTE